MKEGWQVKPLGDLCEILDSRRRPITKKDRIPGPHPYYGANGQLDNVAGYLFDEPLVLLGEDGAKWAAGETSAFAVAGRTWVNNHAHVLRPLRNELNDRWLIHYLNHADLIPFVSGLTVPKLNQANMRSVPVPVPPLAEQERIVRVLDEALDRIATAQANTEANIANARALFDRALNQAIDGASRGLTAVPLSSALESQPRNGWSPPASDQAPAGIPVLTLSAVTGFDYDPTKVKYTTARTDPAAHYWLRPGDLLMTRSNTPKLVGHVAIYDGVPAPVIYPDLVMRMRTDTRVLLSRYAYYALRTEASRDYLTSRAGGASQTMSKITKSVVQELPIALPPVATQEKVVEEIDKARTESRMLGAATTRKLAQVTALRRALLARAFAGEL